MSIGSAKDNSFSEGKHLWSQVFGKDVVEALLLHYGVCTSGWSSSSDLYELVFNSFKFFL